MFLGFKGKPKGTTIFGGSPKKDTQSTLLHPQQVVSFSGANGFPQKQTLGLGQSPAWLRPSGNAYTRFAFGVLNLKWVL